MRKSALSMMLLLAICATCKTGASNASTRKDQPCDAETLAAVAKSLGQQSLRPPSKDEDDRSVVAAACKALPSDERITLVAVAYRLPGEQSDDKKGLFVAMLDSKVGALIHSYKTTIEEDALTQVGTGSLWLDTAPYLIAPDKRAFGLVFTSIAPAPHGVEGWGNHELVLFSPDSDALRPIFQIVLDWWDAHDNGPTVSHSCTVGVGERASHGRKDLIVNETIEMEAADGKVSSQKSHHVVRFNGSVYMTTEPAGFDSLLGTLGHGT